MRRIVIERPGSYHALRLVEQPDPIPGPGEVCIAVEAVGVNYADCVIRMGLYESAKKLHGYPITPGFEVSGRIAAVGQGVQGWAVGDEVLALTLFGGYTSHLCLPTDRVFRRPSNLDARQAAGLPTVFLTAWFMVHEQVHPRPGHRWLVHSAAGGVGSALVQLGKLAGCEVTGVVGAPHKLPWVRELGADHVIDKSAEPLWERARRSAPHGFDAIFDANGVATLGQSYAHLASGGKLLVYGFHSMLPRSGGVPNWLGLAWAWLRTPRFNPLRMTNENRSVLACNLSFLSHQVALLREGMLWLLARFSAGQLRPLPVESFPLAYASEAHQRLESAQSVGKLVLIP